MSIQSQLQSINILKLKYSNGLTFEQVLKKESKRLKDCIQFYIDEYYNSYSPKKYIRSEEDKSLQTSLELSKNIQIDYQHGLLSIILSFNKDKSYSKQMYGDQLMYKPLLINDGWKVEKDVWFKNIPRFGYYEGYHFIEKGIKKFNSSNPYKLKISVVSNIKRKQTS
jgi:hypothetical protein